MVPAVLKYSADTSFYLANESLVNPSVFGQKSQPDLLQVSLVQERVFQLAYSSEMMNYLIANFRLYKHYGIDTTKVDHYAVTVRRLSQNIKFTKVSADLSSVSVTDRNNEVAASMANAIVWKLDQMNKKYLSDKIQANLNFYESFVRESRILSREQNDKFTQSLELLGRYKQVVKNDDVSAKSISEIEYSIYEAIAKIRDLTTELMVARNLYNTALTSQRSKNLPSLVIIKRALPEVKSKKIQLVLLASLAGILACVITFLMMYVYNANRKAFGILFGRKLPEAVPERAT